LQYEHLIGVFSAGLSVLSCGTLGLTDGLLHAGALGAELSVLGLIYDLLGVKAACHSY
jgi:hypothetical protein